LMSCSLSSSRGSDRPESEEADLVSGMAGSP
jgi:hypothetical protein